MKANILFAKEQGEVEGYFVFQGEKFPSEIKKFEELAKQEEFKGEPKTIFGYKDSRRKVLVCGLGERKNFKLNSIRVGAATMLRYATDKKAKSLSIKPPKGVNLEYVTVAIAEGIVLASYTFDRFKSDEKKKKEKESKVEKIYIVEKENPKLKVALKEGISKAEGQNYARELANTPPNIMTPLELAKKAEELAKEKLLMVQIFDKVELENKGMNGILAVNRGSAQPPVMIILEYNVDKKHLPLYAIVGKGITFDSGGINLKPSQGMEDMKFDKTGACVCMGVMKAVAEMKLPIRVMAVIPATENMPGGNAQKPSDIIKMYNKKTVEVLNTDAEGRLILADALSFAAEKKPVGIIDVATLTGAAAVALGRHAIGMLSNDDKLAEIVEKAGVSVHERVWRLPLWEEYSEMMKSEVADIKNISGTGEAGTITAAAFLKEFVGETKWVHLDIAAVDKAKEHEFLSNGSTAIGTRLIVETLKKLARR